LPGASTCSGASLADLSVICPHGLRSHGLSEGSRRIATPSNFTHVVLLPTSGLGVVAEKNKLA